MLSESSSLRIKLIRFPLIVGVVFVHAYDATTPAGGPGAFRSTYPRLIEYLVSQQLARTAVPLFFLLAGYLFFLSFSGSVTDYLEKLRSRSHTVLFPYLIWNAVTLILFIVAQSLPQTAGFFSGKSASVINLSVAEYLAALLGVGRYPISYQLWFLRDLFILSVCSPVILLLVRQGRLPFIAALLALWVLDSRDGALPTAEGLLFFAIGGYLAVNRLSLFFLDGARKPLLAAYVLLIAGEIFWDGPARPLHKPAILCGVFLVLGLSEFLARSRYARSMLDRLAVDGFFVYLAHEPMLTIARKLAARSIRNPSAALSVALYFVLPLAVIFLAVQMHRGFQRICPVAARVLDGGR